MAIRLYNLKSFLFRNFCTLQKDFRTEFNLHDFRSRKSFRLQTSSKFIDIIIPTYRRENRVIELIKLLTRQTKNGDSVIVVWQNLEKPPHYYHSGVKFIHFYKPNLPAARNIGLKESHNEIVLYLDDDVIPENNFLDEHRKCYDNPQTGAVAGFIYDSLFLPSNKPSSFNYHTGELIQNFACETSQKTISFMGAHMSFRRKALQNINGFDIHFTKNALWEEIDCAFRLLNAGYDILFCSNARVKHLRFSKGGCRTEKGIKYVFYYFVNTTFFSCNYIPVRYSFDWFGFWINHLKYLSRGNNIIIGNKNNIPCRCIYTIAGLFGMLTGFIRFLLYGKRKKLPSAVVKAFENDL